MRVERKQIRALSVLAVALVLSACGPSIGDECSNDSQCPAGSYCDKTMPGGFCTISPCREGECPDESVCVKFSNNETYCMPSCGSDGDCRDGYVCIKDIGSNPFCSVLE